jgi:hypothetical protein
MQKGPSFGSPRCIEYNGENEIKNICYMKDL